ncbi:MAG: PLP-dependent aminotransferase family protein [Pseudomonadota bacterium]
MAVPVDTFFLDPDTQGTLQARIQQMIASAILSGRLQPGEKLPSSRGLAKHLSVSRITVTLAYAELVASDYLNARDRSGYYVSDTAPRPPELPPSAPSNSAVDWGRLVTRTSREAITKKPTDWAGYKYPFIYGQPDTELFDHSNWRLCAIRALGQKDYASLTADQYDADDAQLITFIARHILPRRGIAARPDEILITMGAQNALWLSAQVLLTQRRRAAIENPCYPALRAILEQARCSLTEVDVDEAGMPPARIPDDVDVIFATPSHQSPTNATMKLRRRKRLLSRAQQIGAVVVEDDYEFEMSFLQPPLPALKSLDHDGRVIYIGSFSKSIFPGLRLGYLVGPEPFIREARALRSLVLRHPPGLMQRAVAYFLSLGHYDAQVTRMGRTLQDRRSTMETAIQAHGLSVAGSGDFGGSSFWMRAPIGVDTEELAKTLAPQGVLIEPGAPFFSATHRPAEFYRLGYSSIPSARIPEGIARIAASIDAMGTSGAKNA